MGKHADGTNALLKVYIGTYPVSQAVEKCPGRLHLFRSTGALAWSASRTNHVGPLCIHFSLRSHVLIMYYLLSVEKNVASISLENTFQTLWCYAYVGPETDTEIATDGEVINVTMWENESTLSCVCACVWAVRAISAPRRDWIRNYREKTGNLK